MVNEESRTPTYTCTTGASKQTATPDKQIGKHVHDCSQLSNHAHWFIHMHDNMGYVVL